MIDPGDFHSSSIQARHLRQHPVKVLSLAHSEFSVPITGQLPLACE